MPKDPRLLALLLVALIAFAANSVLGRLALAEGAIGPGAFIAIRLVSGAAALSALIAATSGAGAMRRSVSPINAAALFGYAAAFSFAYVELDAGLGALILFGAVQATMFAGALVGGERPGAARWTGAAATLLGLGALVGPGAEAPPLGAAGLMAVAGACWGVYSLRGRRAGPPTPTVAAAFLLAAPAGLALWAAAAAFETEPTGAGIALAVASGALASAGGYAIWYAVLPRMEATVAALAQTTVPLLALAGGAALLDETLTARFAIAAACITGGVALGVVGARR